MYFNYGMLNCDLGMFIINRYKFFNLFVFFEKKELIN